jgi:hypothetical protein
MEFGIFQLPEVSDSLMTVVWLIVGAAALLVVWEVATFAAYIFGVADRRRRR